jgi:hypothetical protein
MIRRPAKSTLKRYGMTEADWLQILTEQDYKCPVCERGQTQGVLAMVIDHQHVKLYRKRPPQERRRYVRGLLCNRCNWQFLRRGMTARIASKIATYLLSHEQRLSVS